MSDISGVANSGGAEAIISNPVTTPVEPDRTPITPREAGKQLADLRWKRTQAAEADQNSEAPAAPEAAAAEPEQVSAPEADAAPPQEAPGETTEPDPAVEEQPSVEPPRSWTKDAKEAFKLLPPALQRDVAELERSREVETRRGQNEVADKLKGLTAKEQQAEQLRQQYEAALPALLQTIQASQSGEFADIKTQEDVNRMANEDWPRFARWQAHRMQMDTIEREVRSAQDRQASEYKSKWSEFASKEDAKAMERIPELADKAKQAKIAEDVMATLGRSDITRDEFAKAWAGEASISPRDSRWQEIMVKAARYDQAKASITKPTAKPVPPVQRPGVSKPKTPADDANVQALKQAFERNPTPRTAAAYKTAQRAASA